MRCMLRRVTFPALIALVCFFPAPGQNINGTIVGAIVDPSGAPISGATVSIEHVSTGAQRSTLSSSTGDFILGSLPPGEYRGGQDARIQIGRAAERHAAIVRPADFG